MSDSLVTVLIPSYNHANYIEQCITSICSQTYKNIELIIIDDGSSDNSLEVISRCVPLIRENTSNFILRHRKNVGPQKTVNEAIPLCSGEYLIIIDSDDIMLKDTIAKYVSFLDKNPDYMHIHGNAYKVYSTDIIDIDKLDLDNTMLSDYGHKPSGNIIEYAIRHPLQPPFLACYRLRCFDEVGLADTEIKFSDVDMYLRLAARYKLKYLPEPVAIHRAHHSNTSHNRAVMEQGIYDYINKYKSYDIGLTDEQREILIDSFKKALIDYNDLLGTIKSKKLIVAWGTGASYQIFKGKYGIDINYFVDSNTKKHGNTLDGKTIYAPEKLLDENKDELYVLVLSSYAEEIYDWLSENGFSYKEMYF